VRGLDARTLRARREVVRDSEEHSGAVDVGLNTKGRNPAR
jgi:hypothetical protein